jgi:hypothetical protein
MPNITQGSYQVIQNVDTNQGNAKTSISFKLDFTSPNQRYYIDLSAANDRQIFGQIKTHFKKKMKHRAFLTFKLLWQAM